MTTEHYVLDGGSLLHRLKWTEGSTYSSIADAYATFTVASYGSTYSSIADAYASFTVASYGKATVIFDGYGEPSTKDITHTRRKTIVGKKVVNITKATKFVGKKDDFLSNESNKKSLIGMIIVCLHQNGCHVIQAEGDADVDIGRASVIMSTTKSTTVIGEDTDLLMLLLYHGNLDSKDLFFQSDKGKSFV